MFWCYWLFVIILFIEAIFHYFFYSDYVSILIRGEEVKLWQLLMFIIVSFIPLINIVFTSYIFVGNIVAIVNGYLHLREKFEKPDFSYLNKIIQFLNKKII